MLLELFLLPRSRVRAEKRVEKRTAMTREQWPAQSEQEGPPLSSPPCPCRSARARACVHGRPCSVQLRRPKE